MTHHLSDSLLGLSVTSAMSLLQVHRSDWSSVRVTAHWIGVVVCSLMCGAATVASLRFIIIDAKVRHCLSVCSIELCSIRHMRNTRSLTRRMGASLCSPRSTTVTWRCHENHH